MNMVVTSKATKSVSARDIAPGVNQHRFLPILIAACTNPMRWSQRVVLWSLRVDQNSSSKILKFILRGFRAPVFYVSQLLFECVFFLQQTLILRLHIEQRSLEFNNRSLRLNRLFR